MNNVLAVPHVQTVDHKVFVQWFKVWLTIYLIIKGSWYWMFVFQTTAVAWKVVSCGFLMLMKSASARFVQLGRIVSVNFCCPQNGADIRGFYCWPRNLLGNRPPAVVIRFLLVWWLPSQEQLLFPDGVASPAGCPWFPAMLEVHWGEIDGGPRKCWSVEAPGFGWRDLQDV